MLILSLIIFYLTSNNPPFPSIMTAISLIVAYFWLYFFSRIAVNILRVLGYCMGIKAILILVIVYPIGNSLSVIIDKVSAARMGLGDMALTGCFASQIMLLVGFFITFLKSSIQLYTLKIILVEHLE